MFKNYLLPISILSGSIIGAGVFSLPYVLRPLGAPLALAFLLIIGLVVALLHLLYADTLMRTPGNHDFVGLSKTYLGMPAYYFSMFIAVAQSFFVLLIYLVLSLSFFRLIFPQIPSWLGLVIFWLIGTVPIFASKRRIAWLEFFIAAGKITIFILIGGLAVLYGSPMVGAQNRINLENLIIPLGVLLFSLSGRASVSEMVNYVGKSPLKSRVIKYCVIFGTLLPAAIYFLFVISAWSLSPQVSTDTVSGLLGRVPPLVLEILGVLGVLSLWSSYVIIGLNEWHILTRDLYLSKFLAGLAVVLLPPLLYLAGLNNFIFLISIVGGVFIAIEGFYIIRMWQKAKIVTQGSGQEFLISGVSKFYLLIVGILLAIALLSVFFVK